MLKIEEYNKSQFIVIKRMVISYRDLKKKTNKLKDNGRHKSKDMVCNLIVVTDRTEIKSLLVVQQDMDDKRYLAILK